MEHTINVSDNPKATHTPITLAQALLLFTSIKLLEISKLDKAYSIGYSIISKSFTRKTFIQASGASASEVSKWVKIANTCDSMPKYLTWYETNKATSVEVAYVKALTYGKVKTSRKTIPNERFIKELAKSSKRELASKEKELLVRLSLVRAEQGRRK